MVKLFIGNLADNVDNHRLKNLFLEYGLTVLECDVLKNFAFVHVPTDDDAQEAIDKLNKYKLEGRDIHIERSTSRLRKEPGMGDKCFSCGALDHKTPNCPQEQHKKKAPKRSGDNENGHPDSKRATIPALSSVTSLASQPQCWGYKVGGGAEGDPELPCPTNPELRTLYDQYLESRTRYFYFRERLAKELSLQPPTAMAVPQLAAPTQPIRIDLTKPMGQPQVQPSYNVVGHQPQPYGAPASGTLSAAAAPYASAYSGNPVSYAGLQSSVPSSMPFSSTPQAYASQPNAYTTSSINGSISSTPGYNISSHYNAVPQARPPPLGAHPPPPTNIPPANAPYNAGQPGYNPTSQYGGGMTSYQPPNMIKYEPR